ncbi:MAG: trypsin-like peptidase domain-containing protein [Myxococcota bacterium]|nr:trypsin-like peptidase domain-containing protein [Myxococcota bacterium]
MARRGVLQSGLLFWIVLPALLPNTACQIRTFGLLGEEAGTALPPGATPLATSQEHPAPAAPPSQSPVAGGVAVRVEPVSFAPIVHAADPSVVTINTVGEEVEESPFTHHGRPRTTRGLGTGFVFDKSGVILTNNHVVEGASAIQVKLSDDRDFPGTIVGTDPATDIAVVRIDTKDLRPLPLGDSDLIEVGDWVVAIGNPYGLSHTVSAGIISAKGRTRQDVPLDPAGYYDFLQTDASINPGNSGGPLLNLKGEVVGMNSAIRGGGAQGIGFAIPINMMKQLLPMLLRDGHVTRSALGIHIADVRELTNEDRDALKLAKGVKISGAVIEAVTPGGPASKAGLQSGDIILAFEGHRIDRSTELQWLASTAGVGRPVTLRIQRAGKMFETKVTLSHLTEQPPPAAPR